MSKYHDTRDIDWRELKLIRVGHALWREFTRMRRENRNLPVCVHQIGPIEEGLETVWRLKRELRVELAEERHLSGLKAKERFDRLRQTARN